jgi:hypothetical protein
MKTQSAITVLLGLILLLVPGIPAAAQTEDPIDAVRKALSGQRLLVTYRDGGALYGTHYFLDVQLCRTGRYYTSAESRRTTILNNQQVNRWRETGTWAIISYENQPVLKYISSAGKTNVAPARLLPEGRIWLGEGVSVQRTGTTACR